MAKKEVKEEKGNTVEKKDKGKKTEKVVLCGRRKGSTKGGGNPSLKIIQAQEILMMPTAL